MSGEHPQVNPQRIVTGRRTGARRAMRLLAAAAAGAAGLIAFAAPSAHGATGNDEIALVSSEPQDGVVLTAAPKEILLQFDKEVPLDVDDTISATCSGSLVVTGKGEYENDRTKIRYSIDSAVPRGTCVVQWLLSKGGTTTVASGTISFSVQAAGATTTPTSGAATTTTAAGAATSGGSTTTVAGAGAPATPATVDAREPDRGFSAALWFGRLVSTAGIMVLFGALVVIGVGWPEGPEYYVTTRFLGAVWLIALVGTVVYVIAYAAQVRGASFAAGVSPAAWLDLSQDGWPGIGAVMRLIAVGASAYVAFAPERLDDPNTGIWAWVIPAIAVITVALSRVSGPLMPVGVIVGVVHAFASAVWFGGAVFVGRVVLAGPGDEDLVVATRLYSRISVLAILATVSTGVMQTIRLDGGNLLSDHGKVVLLKVVAVAVMLFIGLEARKQVRFRLDREYEMSSNNASRFRRAYGSETLFGVMALALSSLLVSISPGTELPWAGEKYVTEVQFIDPVSGVNATVQIGPATVGANGYLIQVSAPTTGISALKLTFIPPAGTQNGQAWIVEDTIPLTGQGSAWRPTANGIPLGVPGQWSLELSATTQQGVQEGMVMQFTVGAPNGSTVTAPAAPTTPPPTAAVTVIRPGSNPGSVATNAPG